MGGNSIAISKDKLGLLLMEVGMEQIKSQLMAR